jgi:hypothetical protein
MISGRECGTQILPRNDSHRREIASKKRIMQRVIELLQSNVSEDTIMKALNAIPRPTSEENVHVVPQATNEPQEPSEGSALFDVNEWLTSLTDQDAFIDSV